MGVEVRPLGIRCNLSCTYCYQEPMRAAGNSGPQYDLDAIKAALDEEGRPFTLFGGEPLLLPREDLEDLLSYGYDKYGVNNIQTNGVLITEAHIRLFQRYNVHIGFSIDGPGDLNDLRWAGSLDKTRDSTEKAIQNLKTSLHEGLSASVIVTLHSYNAGDGDRLERLTDWLHEIHDWGVESIRLHPVELESTFDPTDVALTQERLADVYLAMFDLVADELPNSEFDIYSDMRAALQGHDRGVTCVWSSCDPWTTAAVTGVDGDGRRSNCGRTNKDGVDWIKSESAGYERYLALYQTPQEYGGCKDCRFWLVCKGECPGTALGGDPRNRSLYCETWKRLFASVEEALVAEGVEPLSLRSDREDIELAVFRAWMEGRDLAAQDVLSVHERPVLRWRVPVGRPAGS